MFLNFFSQNWHLISLSSLSLMSWICSSVERNVFDPRFFFLCQLSRQSCDLKTGPEEDIEEEPAIVGRVFFLRSFSFLVEHFSMQSDPVTGITFSMFVWRVTVLESDGFSFFNL